MLTNYELQIAESEGTFPVQALEGLEDQAVHSAVPDQIS